MVIPELAVQADVAGGALPLGEPIRVRVAAADPTTRQVALEAV